MDFLKKLLTSKALIPSAESKTLKLQSTEPRMDVGSSGSGSTVSSSVKSEKSRESVNPTRESMKESGSRFDEYQKDLDQNFPNDPEAWLKSRLKLADGLEPPKK